MPDSYADGLTEDCSEDHLVLEFYFSTKSSTQLRTFLSITKTSVGCYAVAVRESENSSARRKTDFAPFSSVPYPEAEQRA